MQNKNEEVMQKYVLLIQKKKEKLTSELRNLRTTYHLK